MPASVEMKSLLIIRLSALGDVAILASVLPAWLDANPEVEFTVAGPPLLEPLFERLGKSNLHYLGVKKRQPARDIYRQLSATHPDAVADLHVVNRVLPSIWMFRLRGLKVRSLRKGRWSRWLWLHGHSKKPRRPQWMRYADVLQRMGLNTPSTAYTSETPLAKTEACLIGIAPFAQHRGKIWPIGHVEELSQMLTANGWQVVLFGSKDEAPLLDPIATRIPGVTSAAGKQEFASELQLISSLTLMVSMDSANMHFASALGVPVVSIWGATHPKFGFYGYGQPAEASLCAELPCQPCSAFGQKACRFTDYRCLEAITPQMVMQKIEHLVSETQKNEL